MPRTPFDLTILPDVPTTPVTCTLGGPTNRSAVVRAYDYYNREPRNTPPRCYRVPLYELRLAAAGSPATYQFKVIRYGVVVGTGRVDTVSSGAPQGTYELIWQEGYPGWRLVSTTEHRRTSILIHNGANRPLDSAWGAANCIEVTGVDPASGRQEWTTFNRRVRELSKVPASWTREWAHKLIQKNHSFHLVVRPATRPPRVAVPCPSR